MIPAIFVLARIKADACGLFKWVSKGMQVGSRDIATILKLLSME